MKPTRIRRLALKRETLRRLAADDLTRVAGGRLTCCTYTYSGCKVTDSRDCNSEACDVTDTCETKDCAV